MGKMIPSPKIKWFVVIITALCLASWGGSPASARDARPCDADAAKFCKDGQPGGGSVIKCLKNHENDLSLACREDMAKMQMKAPAFIEACRDDVRKFCNDVKPGEGRIIQCLKSHENEVSSQCRASLPPQR